jgi:large subunit ribosomal protein L40
MEEKLADFQLIDTLLMSQNKALQELKLESEELYLEAIQADLNLVPFKTRGPVASPPLDNYESPDGEYIDVSKKWD